MRRASIIGGALLLLAGCPLPQPLPDYPKGTVTPPRILMDELERRDTVIRVPAGCPGTKPAYELAAALVDHDTTETITARWFVDYDRENSAFCTEAIPETVIPGPGDGAADPTRRSVPSFRFVPYDPAVRYGAGTASSAPGVVHVVELVVSNRFDPASDTTSLCAKDTAAWPYRTPARDTDVEFETQTYRWIFVTEPPSAELVCPGPSSP